MCGFRKYAYSRPTEGTPGQWGFCKVKPFKELYEALLEYLEGWGVLEKISLSNMYTSV